jgi:hypothetical protein
LTATNLFLSNGWTPNATNSADTNGLFSFSDVTTNFPQRFYRLTTP